MNDIPFYRSQMGHRFYETTAASLVRELARLNDNLERLLAIVERDAKIRDQQTTDAKPPAGRVAGRQALRRRRPTGKCPSHQGPPHRLVRSTYKSYHPRWKEVG